ncbi:hypothetical protein NAEGRDRAFT_82314 [Naegleria gruberi]|uniref:Uncharacterized protein n=1 Tax=Naegleria gruberi TaxID=5762 RepID=D2W4G2_NAEGR|nr:uncharacterized protein NAEGRDRAFT_82314 [Naegleria gruberi]EFC36038.1 hypothetical protein NAEGRDRAFT_82314 [Naegleria gruberi]|eukprot:XP_002668782.1 hypothetical protein NAEGRDRAFT_82314 [Naegleria gruberi strain NEG-M]
MPPKKATSGKEKPKEKPVEKKAVEAKPRFLAADKVKLKDFYLKNKKAGVKQESVFTSFGQLYGYSNSQVRRAYYSIFGKQKTKNETETEPEDDDVSENVDDDMIERQEFTDRMDSYLAESEQKTEKKRKRQLEKEPTYDDDDDECDYEQSDEDYEYSDEDILPATPSKVTKVVSINDKSTSLFRPFRFESETHRFIIYRFPTWTDFKFSHVEMSKEKMIVIHVKINAKLSESCVVESFAPFAKNLKANTDRKDEQFTIKEPVPKDVDVKTVKCGPLNLKGVYDLDDRVFAVLLEKKLQTFAPTFDANELSNFIAKASVTSSSSDTQLVNTQTSQALTSNSTAATTEDATGNKEIANATQNTREESE